MKRIECLALPTQPVFSNFLMNVQASSHNHHHHLSCSTGKTPVVQASRPNINACPAPQRSSSPVHTDQVMVSQLGRGRSLYVLPDAAIEFSVVHRSEGTQAFSVHGMSHWCLLRNEGLCS